MPEPPNPQPSAGSPSAGIRVSPFCVHLRSKKSYFLREPPLEEGDVLDGSGHCWCQKTMLALGPDGDPAVPADCRTGRACYQSIL